MIDGQELETIVTNFLRASREAAASYFYCADQEHENNDKTQDILHAIEIAPELLSPNKLLTMLHKIRCERRTAKRELMVSHIFFDWTEKHKKEIKELEKTLGEIRKELKQQPTLAYNWRSDIIGEKGSWLQHDNVTLVQPGFPEWNNFLSNKS